MGKFVRKVFAVVKNAGYDTNNMSIEKAFEIYEKAYKFRDGEIKK